MVRKLFLPEMIVVYRLSSKEMDTATRVQILDEAVCISHSANTIWKGIHLTILPLAVDI